MVIPTNMDQLYLKVYSQNVRYVFDPPYVKNWPTLSQSITYPVLKGNMAHGGDVSA